MYAPEEAEESTILVTQLHVHESQRSKGASMSMHHTLSQEQGHDGQMVEGSQIRPGSILDVPPGQQFEYEMEQGFCAVSSL